MGKIVAFVLVLFIISVYPLFEIKSAKKIKEYNVTNIIPIEITNGKYFVYEGFLTKEGSFFKLDLFKEKIKAFELSLYDLVKKEKLFAKRAVYKNPLLEGFEVAYSNKDYNIFASYAVYNQKDKNLSGKKFKIFSLSYRGFGDSFSIDKNKNIEAKNINYFLKVK